MKCNIIGHNCERCRLLVNADEKEAMKNYWDKFKPYLTEDDFGPQEPTQPWIAIPLVMGVGMVIFLLLVILYGKR